MASLQYGAPPVAPVAAVEQRPRQISAHPSHASWLHRDLHRRPSHGGPVPFRHKWPQRQFH
eukprot:5194924-Pyramimonas_sp.AAC.1